MDGREEECGKLCAPEHREKGEVGLDEVTEVRSEEAKCEGEIAIPGRPEFGYTADKPIVEAAQEGGVATSGADPEADVEEECKFEPGHFWLLLKEAGYESW